MRLKTLLFCAFVAFLLISMPAPCQPSRSESSPKPRIGQAVRSPEVQSDGRVTFRFRAPNAKQVQVVREGAQPLTMQKNDQGIWSATTEALPPDLYTYQFAVDGVALADPANPMFKPIVIGGSESIVHVPGPASLQWEPKDVPRGTLHRHLYRSARIGETREFLVYTPPGYDPAAKQTYPVFYLLHGVMEDASAWTASGQANVILDNLIAERKAKPMMVVMPCGYGFANPPDRMAEQFSGPAAQKKIMDVLTASLLEEVIPQVERAYRVTKDREARAIAGVSMGGSQALYIGLNHRERFAWVGSFSGALIMYGNPFDTWFPGLTAEAKPGLRLLWVACGSEDFLFNVNQKYKDWLKARKVPFTPIETPGAHTWMVWRRNLIEFAPLLFRQTP